jgi:hypothetical protein
MLYPKVKHAQGKLAEPEGMRINFYLQEPSAAGNAQKTNAENHGHADLCCARHGICGLAIKIFENSCERCRVSSVFRQNRGSIIISLSRPNFSFSKWTCKCNQVKEHDFLTL